MMPTTSPLVRNAIKPTWDGSSQGWPRFLKATRNCLVHLDLTHVLPAVAKMTKATFPDTEVNAYGPLASGAEAPADDADEEARAAAAARAAARAELDVADLNKVFVMLEEAVPGHVLDDIQAGAGDEMDPVDLWRRFAEHAKGLVVDLSGEALFNELFDWKFPATGEGGGTTFAARVAAAFAELHEFLKRWDTIRDESYPIREATCCARFRAVMPARFRVNHSAYKGTTSLKALRTQANYDAAEFDLHPETAPAFAAVPGGAKPEVPTASDTGAHGAGAEVVQLLQALVAANGGGRNQARHQPRGRLPDERRADRAAGPPTPKHHWCEHHKGWYFHESDECSLRPKGGKATTPDAGTTYYKRGPDGKLVESSTKPAFSALQALAAKGDAPTTDIYVDSATATSLTNSLKGMSDVTELDPATAPSICGATPGVPIRQTHSGRRLLLVGGCELQEQVYYAPDNQFNLLSTTELQRLGVSTIVCADGDVGMVLLCGDSATPCRRVGGIWALPPGVHAPCNSPMTATTPALAAPAMSKAPPTKREPTTPGGGSAAPAAPLPPPPARSGPPAVSYHKLRTTLGVPSDAAVRSAAKKLGARLVHAERDRQALDAVAAVANQAAKPATKVAGRPALPSERGTVVTTDTLGGPQPLSASGNRYAQTWENLTDGDGCYVTTSADKTAASSWLGFKQFARDSGLVVLGGGCINQPITIRSDGGSEYLGEFRDNARDCGIRTVMSVPYKHNSGVQHRAEHNNHVVQKHMRANLALAAGNFRQLGLHVGEYWDHALQHGAVQARVLRRLRDHDGATPRSLFRDIPTGWGGWGTVTLQAASPRRKRGGNKQLAPRAEIGLYLGRDQHAHLMLMRNGGVMRTTDVKFHDQPYEIPRGTGGSASTPCDRRNDAQPPLAPAHSDEGDGSGSDTDVGDQLDDDDDEAPVDADAGDQLDGVDAPGGPYDDAAELPAETSVNDTGELVIGADQFQPALATRPSRAPHPSVAAFITTQGDVRPELLLGTETLPPPPALPAYHRQEAPAEPSTFAEAFAGPDAIHWLHAALREYRGHRQPERRTPTWAYTTQRPDGRRLFLKAVFTRKWRGFELDKFKVRIVCAGWGLVQGEHYTESYTGTAPISDLRDLEALAVQLDLLVFEVDLTMAYCWSRMPSQPNGEPVVVEPCVGIRTFTPGGRIERVELLMALYGHPASGYALAKQLHTEFVNECPIPFKQSWAQPVTFRAVFEPGHKFHGEMALLWINNDNIRMYTSDERIQHEFRGWLASKYDITGGETPLQRQPPQQVLGIVVTYRPGSVTLRMPAYVEQLLTKHGMGAAKPATTPLPADFAITKADCPTTEAGRRDAVDTANRLFRAHQFPDYPAVHHFYRSLVSAISWIATQCGAELAQPVSLLGRVMHQPPAHALAAAKRVLRWLAGNRDIGVTYIRTQTFNWRRGQFPQYMMFSDASYGDVDGLAQGGYCGGWAGQACSTFKSQRSKRVCTSTFMAESTFASEACREIEYKRNVWNFLGIPQVAPTPLRVDNAATVLAGRSLIRKFSPRSKQFGIEQQYVNECAEKNICCVEQTPGELNPADVMTKCATITMLDRHRLALRGPDRG